MLVRLRSERYRTLGARLGQEEEPQTEGLKRSEVRFMTWRLGVSLDSMALSCSFY